MREAAGTLKIPTLIWVVFCKPIWRLLLNDVAAKRRDASAKPVASAGPASSQAFLKTRKEETRGQVSSICLAQTNTERRGPLTRTGPPPNTHSTAQHVWNNFHSDLWDPVTRPPSFTQSDAWNSDPRLHERTLFHVLRFPPNCFVFWWSASISLHFDWTLSILLFLLYFLWFLLNLHMLLRFYIISFTFFASPCFDSTFNDFAWFRFTFAPILWLAGHY